MTGTDIREALRAIGDDLDTPPQDRAAFQHELRRARRAHVGRRVVASTAVAACVGVLASVVGGTDHPGRAVDVTSPGTTGEVGDLVFVVVGRQLRAYDSVGVTTAGVGPVEGMLGFTQERAYVVDAESRLAVVAVVDDPESPAPAGFSREEAPYDGPVSSAALSSDGRYLAWLDLGGTVTVRDEKADDVAFTADVGENAYVADVAAAGVLVADGRSLTLHTPEGGEIEVPSMEGSGWGSRVAGDGVLAADIVGATLYRRAGEGLEEVRGFDGRAELSPTGDQVVVAGAMVERPGLILWDGLEEHDFAGLEGGTVDEARWVDDGSDAGLVLATGYGPTGLARLWSCDPVDLVCGDLGTDGQVASIAE